jgi:hypothetical protein
MDQTSRHTETELKAVAPSAAVSTDPLLAHVQEVWPERPSQRDVANLPRPAFDAVRGHRRRGPLAQAAARLDHMLPGWPEAAAAAVSRAASGGVGEDLQRAAALLAHRPIRRPEPLLAALDSCEDDPESRLWLLVALSGTDTPSVRAAWLDRLRRGVAREPAQPDRALWFAFLRAFLGGWLDWTDFRDCLTRGQVLSAAHPKGDYRRALHRLRLSSHPLFTKWYRQVVYEVAHQPDVSLASRTGGWIRDFPDEEYLWDALAQLESAPTSWWPLYVIRWVSRLPPDDERISHSLQDFSPPTLCLLSLIRPDLSRAAALALGMLEHEPAVHWLKTSGPSASLDTSPIEDVLRPWASQVGEPMTLAVGALCALDLPEDVRDPEPEALRRRIFVRQLLLPEFNRVVDNLFHVYALRKDSFTILVEQARKGRPTAARALALWPEKVEETAPLLFDLARRGSKLARRAAREALDALRAETSATSLEHMEKRVDLASAWADAGLEGKPSRVWWDVAGCRVKLSVAAGTVRLDAYSGSQRLTSLPRNVRDDPQYPEIRQARADLARSYRYFRRRLQQAMVDDVRYSGGELAVLLANPLVRSLISRLVLTVDGAFLRWAPADPFEASPPPQELTGAAQVAIAHPVALSGCGALDQWQQRVIAEHIAQPFKQVFRETYLAGETERAATSSARFAGHPLVARRAFALLRQRGYAPGRGLAVREWPSLNLRACLRWAAPDEDAGRLLAAGPDADPVTSGPVWFEDHSADPLCLEAVPPVVFSETLRDADLVVSLAAAGELGFSSHETRRVRAALIRYLARAVGLTNIYVGDDDTHVLVEGTRAMYRLHLGSGSVLLEHTRRHLDLGGVRSAQMEALLGESLDSNTARIIGLITALSQDSQITHPEFLRQVDGPSDSADMI